MSLRLVDDDGEVLYEWDPYGDMYYMYVELQSCIGDHLPELQNLMSIIGGQLAKS